MRRPRRRGARRTRSTARTCCCSCRISRRSARRPAITIANPPYTGGEAADWWREAAKAAILIRQVYFTSPGPKGLIALGPARASRSMRKGMRGLVTHFGAIGIPASRSRSSCSSSRRPARAAVRACNPRPPGSSSSSSRRSRRSRWRRIRRSRASGRGAGRASPSPGTIPTSRRPPASTCGRATRSCVTRLRWPAPVSTRRCTEGQIELPAGVRCTFGARTIAKDDVGRDAALTGDLSSAATALLQRVVLRADQPVDPQTVLAAERAIVRDRFGGSRLALSRSARCSATDAGRRARDHRRPARAGPRQGAVPAAARDGAPDRRLHLDVLGDERAPRLRRRAGAVARRCAARLRGRDDRAGAGVHAAARPAPLASTRSTAASTCARSGPRCRCFALPPARAQDVARAVLGRFAKDDVYQRWLRARETALLGDAVCARDDVPAPGDVDLTLWAPFLGA